MSGKIESKKAIQARHMAEAEEYAKRKGVSVDYALSVLAAMRKGR